MECSLVALIACFSWSNLYLDTGVSFHDRGEYFTATEHAALLTEQGDLIQEAAVVRTANNARNPYGRLSLGYQIDFTELSWRMELSHVSSLETGKDRGVNSLSISARWYPFRQ